MDEAKRITLKAGISIGILVLALSIIALRGAGVQLYFLGLTGTEWAAVFVVLMLFVQLSNLKHKVARIILYVVLIVVFAFCSLIYLFVRNEFRPVRDPITNRTFVAEIQHGFLRASEVIGHYELRSLLLRPSQQISNQGRYISVNTSPFETPTLIQIYASDGYILGKSAFPLRSDLNWSNRSFDEIIVTYQGDQNPDQPIRDIILRGDSIQYAYTRGGLAVPARVDETFAVTPAQYQEIRERLSNAPLASSASPYQIQIRVGSLWSGTSVTIFIDGTVFHELLTLRASFGDEMLIPPEPEEEPIPASDEFRIVTDLTSFNLLAREQEDASDVFEPYTISSPDDRSASYEIWGILDATMHSRRSHDPRVFWQIDGLRLNYQLLSHDSAVEAASAQVADHMRTLERIHQVRFVVSHLRTDPEQEVAAVTLVRIGGTARPLIYLYFAQNMPDSAYVLCLYLRMSYPITPKAQVVLSELAELLEFDPTALFAGFAEAFLSLSS